MKHKLTLLAAAALFALGCNLVTHIAATRTASAPTGAATSIPGTFGFQGGAVPTLFVVAPSITPLVADGFGAQAAATPFPQIDLTTGLTYVPTVVGTPSVPLPVVQPETQGAIEWVIAQIVIPTWNFLYTLVVNGVIALWVYAGDRGGLTAQVCGCLLPIALVGFFLIRSTLRRLRAF